jgi:hypothetical protein
MLPWLVLLQVIEQMGNYALRGVMFNMCMPVTTGGGSSSSNSARHTPLTSRSDTPEEAAAAEGAAAAIDVEEAYSSSRVGRLTEASALDAASAGAAGDVARRQGQQDRSKQPAAGGVFGHE